MKKGLLIGGIVFVVLIAILIAIPFVFRDALLEKTRTSINRDLNVTIGFQDFRLSLIKDFPKASLRLQDVTVTGKGTFDGDTLLHVKSLRTSFGLLDLFSPNDLTINEIILDEANLKLFVNADNQVNWQIFPEETETVAEGTSEEAESTFGLQLSKIEIKNANVSYTDITLPMQMDFKGINMLIDGKMYGSDTKLNANGVADQVNLLLDGINYISKTRLGIKSLLDINFDTMDFRFSEGELLVNNLPLDLQGNFSMPGDSMYFDLGFASKASTLGEILALTPPEYETYLKDLNATGNASFTGSFKGYYFGESYPDLQVQLRLAGGNARYAGMPEEIKNISGNISVIKPQGGFNKTQISISNAHFEIRNNPMDMNLNLGNLMEDLRFDGKIAGRLNFDHLKDALPLDSLDMAGLLDINLTMKGNYSAIENKRYERIQTDGVVVLNDFVYNSKELTQPIKVSSGRLDFAPDKINLRQMDMKIGQSDMALSGTVTDYYPYIFSKGTLRGTMQLSSNYLNLNELIQLPVETTPQGTAQVAATDNNSRNNNQQSAANTQEPTSATAFNVPEQINLSIQTDVKRALYDKLNISNITGQVSIDNGKLDLRGVNMNLLDGEMRIAGSYANTPQNKPLVDMAIELVRFDIPTAFQSLKLVRNYLPIAQQSKGRFSTTINLKGQLDENMELIMPSLNGTGLFNSFNVQVLNSPIFNKIKSVLNEEKLRDLRIDDFAANFTIENGNLVLRPFETKVAGQQAVFAGRLNVDNLIDMQIGFLINRDALSKNIENTIGFLPGQQNIQIIPVGIAIKGPVKDPNVNVDLSDAKDLVRQEVKNATKEELQKTINRLGDGLRKLLK
jgi:uncharacterized protein involved in outer membrane biogenesis